MHYPCHGLFPINFVFLYSSLFFFYVWWWTQLEAASEMINREERSQGIQPHWPQWKPQLGDSWVEESTVSYYLECAPYFRSERAAADYYHTKVFVLAANHIVSSEEAAIETIAVVSASFWMLCNPSSRIVKQGCILFWNPLLREDLPLLPAPVEPMVSVAGQSPNSSLQVWIHDLWLQKNTLECFCCAALPSHPAVPRNSWWRVENVCMCYSALKLCVQVQTAKTSNASLLHDLTGFCLLVCLFVVCLFVCLLFACLFVCCCCFFFLIKKKKKQEKR